MKRFIVSLQLGLFLNAALFAAHPALDEAVYNGTLRAFVAGQSAFDDDEALVVGCIKILQDRLLMLEQKKETMSLSKAQKQSQFMILWSDEIGRQVSLTQIFENYGHLLHKMFMWAISKEIGVRYETDVPESLVGIPLLSNQGDLMMFGLMLNQKYSHAALHEAIITEEMHCHRHLIRILQERSINQHYPELPFVLEYWEHLEEQPAPSGWWWWPFSYLGRLFWRG